MLALVKKERNWFVEQMQRFASLRRCRVTFLSGDVHCAAVGLFKTLRQPKEADVPPYNDHRYMLNIVSSAYMNGLAESRLTNGWHRCNR